MKKISKSFWVILWKEFTQFRLQPSLIFYGIAAACITTFLWCFSFYNATISIRSLEQIEVIVQAMTNTYASRLSFPIAMMFSLQIIDVLIMREKTTKTLETLLTSPGTPMDIWLGKTIAAFTLSWIPALITTIVSICITQQLSVHKFINLSASSWAALLIGCPAILLFCILLTHLLVLLLENPRFLGFIYFLAMFVVLYGSAWTINKQTGALVNGSLYLVGFGGCFITLFIGWVLLDKERICRAL